MLTTPLKKARGFEGSKAVAEKVAEAREHKAQAPNQEPKSETLELSVTDVEKLQ